MFGSLFVSFCIGCQKELEAGELICHECLENLPAVQHKCSTCGQITPVHTEKCARCISSKHFGRIYADYEYAHPVSTLLKSIKFKYRLHGFNFLASLIKTDPSIFMFYDLIVPIPSHVTRRFRRFKHPADILAEKISKLSGTPYEKILKRNRRTAYQWKLKKNQRKYNVKGAFSVNSNVNGLKILLVDDIITTGFTASECAEILIKSGALQVDIYTLSGKPL